MFARLATFATVLASVSATSVILHNACSFKVDPAFFPAATLPSGVATGGFPLAAGASASVTLASGYSGRIWGRTGCTAAGVCSTGQCFTGGENCTSSAAAGPTLAQFTLNGYASLDFFDPTSGDGFNVAVTIQPGSGCMTKPVSCTGANNAGAGCGQTNTCPTGTNYTIQFC